MSHRLCRKPPGIVSILARGPWSEKTGEGGASRPDSGSEREVGEEIEEVARYLVVCSVRVGTAGGGSSACSSMPAAAWLGNERGNNGNV